MASDPQPIEIGQSPELLRLVEEIEQGGQPRRLCRGGRTVAILSPAPREAPGRAVTTRRRRSGILGPSDPFWQLAGIGRSGLGDVSSNKHKYLADAYYPKDEQP